MIKLFCYDDNPQPFTGAPKNWETLPANARWLEHYGNLLFLRFIIANPISTFQEKQQARKEVEIAHRKMNWWAKHPNYNHEYCSMEAKKIAMNWK